MNNEVKRSIYIKWCGVFDQKNEKKNVIKNVIIFLRIKLK